jgi:hypothetical protein
MERYGIVHERKMEESESRAEISNYTTSQEIEEALEEDDMAIAKRSRGYTGVGSIQTSASVQV